MATTERNWFTSLFCSKCFNPKEEKQNEMTFEGRFANYEKRSTVITQLKPIKVSKGNPYTVDSNDFKTQLSSKDVEHFESRLLQAATAVNTPRYDVELEVIESDFLNERQKFRIRPSGYVNESRVLNHGRVHIGSEGSKDTQPEGKNDIVCSKFKNNTSIQTACLSFDEVDFYLSDLGGGDGIYIKAENKIPLDHQSIVHYGIGHFVVEFMNGKEKNQPLLKIRLLDGQNENMEKILQPDQVCTFGRLPTCTIVFNEYGISKIQCKIFCENGQWFIKDGDGHKKSTNGTWLLLQKKVPISPKMIFKVCNTVFRANLIDSA